MMVMTWNSLSDWFETNLLAISIVQRKQFNATKSSFSIWKINAVRLSNDSQDDNIVYKFLSPIGQTTQ